MKRLILAAAVTAIGLSYATGLQADQNPTDWWRIHKRHRYSRERSGNQGH